MAQRSFDLRRFSDLGRDDDYQDFFPVTLKQGEKRLVSRGYRLSERFFGFEPGTEYTVSNGCRLHFFPTPIHVGDTFTLDIRAENISDLAGWQFDIAFDPTALEAVDVSEGDFLKMDGSSTFFHGGTIDNAAGKIGGLSAARLLTQGGVGPAPWFRSRSRQNPPVKRGDTG